MMNNRRIRHPSTTTYLRYLKPGALAQLRDSKIKTITHQIYLNRSISSPVRSPASTQQEEDVNRSPGFTVRYNGPRCLQRKKLLALRSICFNTNGTISNGPEPVIGAFSNGFLVAH
ncbi:hypothetical protein CTI12_AA070410 [Artemisia annua]|uniref:Uncharacterized protein n=1 Tax=Artemisia annua TaxID=35608 RepID=A0A2U1Q5T9_ARTAN|nr:hypothetical protein CTI12_AA070410 [Artemisia annua]